jgi:MFS family permease
MKFDNITKIKLIYFFKSLFFFSPIITLFYFSRNLDTFQIVSLEAFLILAVLISEIPTGIIADRLGRKWSLIMLTSLYLIGNVWTIYAHSYWEFITVQLVFGIGIAFGSGAIEALVYDSLKAEKKEKQMTKVWGSINYYTLIASLIAVTVGGYLAKDHNPESFVMLIWLYVVGTIIALIISFFVKEEKHYKEVKRQNPLVLFKESTKTILQNKSLRKIIYLSTFTAPFAHVIIFLFQPYFLMAKVPNSLFGIAMAIGMLLAALFNKYIYKVEEHFGMKKTIFIATILPGILYILMALFINPAASFILYILHKGSRGMRISLFADYQNRHIKSYKL